MNTTLPRKQERFAPASVHASILDSILNPVPTSISPTAPGILEASCLAHDARNWLTVLQVYCDLLRHSGAVASGYEAWMEELSSAVARGQELVLSLLDSVERTFPAVHAATEFFPRVSIPHIAVPHPFDIGNTIARRLPFFQRLAGNNIHVEIDTPDKTGDVPLSENEFERILQNLVGNAIEAMPHGGRLRISLCHRLNQKNLILRVRDTGGGIAPERLPYIFEAGVSGKSKSGVDYGRHGFGLTIVRELTERAGGTVRVRSQLGRGSCFEVELPMV